MLQLLLLLLLHVCYYNFQLQVLLCFSLSLYLRISPHDVIHIQLDAACVYVCVGVFACLRETERGKKKEKEGVQSRATDRVCCVVLVLINGAWQHWVQLAITNFTAQSLTPRIHISRHGHDNLPFRPRHHTYRRPVDEPSWCSKLLTPPSPASSTLTHTPHTHTHIKIRQPCIVVDPSLPRAL